MDWRCCNGNFNDTKICLQTFDPNHNATLGADFALKRVRVEDRLIKCTIMYIAGQERFIVLAPTYYKHAVAAIVVFDITRDTLENAKKWKADVDDKVFLRNGDHILWSYLQIKLGYTHHIW